MDNSKNLQLLFQYACGLKFNDFCKLFLELESSLPIEEFWEAYLMKIQIKLYATDETLLNDLQKIDKLDKQTIFPCLSSRWQVDAPNRFIVFSKTPNALYNFLQILPQINEKFSRWYGETGGITVCQIQCEIYYFMGELNKAIDLAEEMKNLKLENKINAILLYNLLFRCYLAIGSVEKAEQCMLEMIRLSKVYPECLASYQAIRRWANLTTSWNGDTPRFYYDSNGKKLPVLEDRLDAIRMGFARMTPLEEPFVRYAEHNYEGVYTLREYYMDLFHAMYWFQVGDYQQTELYFLQIYHLASVNGILMPMIECGKQITPLLHYVKNSHINCSHDWIDKVIFLADQYEDSLNIYRASNN